MARLITTLPEDQRSLSPVQFPGRLQVTGAHIMFHCADPDQIGRWNGHRFNTPFGLAVIHHGIIGPATVFGGPNERLARGFLATQAPGLRALLDQLKEHGSLPDRHTPVALALVSHYGCSGVAAMMEKKERSDELAVQLELLHEAATRMAIWACRVAGGRPVFVTTGIDLNPALKQEPPCVHPGPIAYAGPERALQERIRAAAVASPTAVSA